MEDLGGFVDVLAVYVGEVAGDLAVRADEDPVHAPVDFGVVGLDAHGAEDYLGGGVAVLPADYQL